MSTAAFAITAVFAWGCGDVSSEDAPGASAGCSLEIAPIVESTAFTPIDGQWGHTGPAPRLTAGPVDQARLTTPPYAPSIDGLDAIAEVVTDGQIREVYYASRGVDGQRPTEVLAGGGILLRSRPTPDGEPPAAVTMAQLFPDRVNEARIGDYEGVISWDDPSDDSGVRPHRALWAQDGIDYELVAVRDPEEMLALARGLVCRETAGQRVAAR